MVNNQFEYFACRTPQFTQSEKSILNRCNVTYGNTSETGATESIASANHYRTTKHSILSPNLAMNR